MSEYKYYYIDYDVLWTAQLQEQFYREYSIDWANLYRLAWSKQGYLSCDFDFETNKNYIKFQQ